MSPCTLCEKTDSPIIILGVCKSCAIEIKTSLNNYKEGAWSKLYIACVVCHLTERKVHSFGKCWRCYQIDYRREKRENEAANQREKVRTKLLTGQYSSKDGRCIACEGLFLKGEEKIDTSFSGEKTTWYHRKCWLKELE
ncbi:MAG: hypothetical protein G01um10147_781 [Microgenomates group bacterium Gr01-1014_7]|nr:MAG: hypothetical protein G01um10147_781 [Microgenomates group bacterium Gr01-1014_7]